MANKKSWSELSPRSKVAAVLAAIVELVLTSVALSDLRRRERSGVRGPKWIWGLVCFVQPVGPLLYLLVGRRAQGS